MLLCAWAAAFYMGVLLGLFGTSGAWRLGLVCGALVVAAGALVWRRRPALAVLVGFLGTGVGLGAWVHRPDVIPAVVAVVLGDAADTAEVEGLWLRTLRPEGNGTGARGLVDTARVAGAGFARRLALTLPPGRPPPRAGDRIRFRARLSLPRGLANPGQPDAAWLARAQGIGLVGSLPREGHIDVVAAGRTWGLRRLAESSHVAMAEAIDRGVHPARAPLLKALVLGERTAAGPEVEAGVKAAGAVHALSVSGLHLTAIAGVVFLLLRRSLLTIPRIALRVRTDLIAAAIAIPLVLFYCVVTGEATATRRAALMAALALGAVVLGRMPSLSSAIGAAALLLMIDSPLLAIDPSYQLSFASVIALALISGLWQPLGDQPWWRRAFTWIVRSGAVSLAAFVATAPLVAHHFAEVAPLSPLGNLVLVPPVELGIVPLGLFGAALGAAWPTIALPVLTVADWLCVVVLWLAEQFRQRAPLVPIVSPDGFEAITLFVGTLFALAALRGGALRNLSWLVAGFAALLGATHLGWRAAALRSRGDVAVTFLDVGQGDAALIEGPGGFIALIDGGGAVEGTFDPGARVIEPVLRRKTIGAIDLVVLSHPHPDHMNGLFRVLERFPVGALWTSGDGAGDAHYERLIALARRRGVRVERPRELTQSGLRLVPLAPFVGDQIAPPPGLGANDASLVIRLDFRGRRVLFTGDIEEQGEAELLGRHNEALRSDVLKVPHHGSRTSSGDDLLAEVAPVMAVASLGFRNRFAFPRPEIRARYAAWDIPLFRTDRSGALTVEITQEGILRTTCVRSCR
ncbi:MAG TPA: DNA internalization-related competence protein ComEC/Rec2 [Polyangia bacterium]